MAEAVATPQQKGLWFKVEPILIRMLDTEQVANLSGEDLHAYLKNTVNQLGEKLDLDLSPADKQYLYQQLLNETTGFGPIEPLMQDRTIADILVNGPEQVYIERNGKLELTDIQFRNREHAMHLMMRALGASGRRVDISKPYVDVILADGSRLNAVIAPLVAGGPVISIRKFHYDRFSLADLQRAGFMSKEATEYLYKATRAHLNIIIVGGAGVGKTTLLNALLQEVQPSERVVIIEDTSELQLKNKHAIRMQTRLANIEGQGEITQRELLRNSLRMRPDRIVVGEIRGPEVLEMFQAMNIGYDGSLSSVHASSVEELPLRLTNMAMLTGYDFSPDFVYRQIAASIHVVVQLGRFADGSRRITDIAEVTGFEQNRVLFNTIYHYGYDPNDKQYRPVFAADKIQVLSTEKMRQYGLLTDNSTGAGR